jgi:hypothetical protein
MFAKAIKQDEEIKKIFYERIKEKVEREKQNVKDKIDEEYPKILSWLDSFIFSHSYLAKWNFYGKIKKGMRMDDYMLKIEGAI